ncbi:MAG: bifunctional UDP-N-acetylglucosamine diphosphorylase/glucosamine-1-phosphate N-acetyltransferase GlmU [Tatlockia sp.]|nr:bifunctional UDP-N-acetylglucosamine diphosphorylase/glucosamine-1-phosphate N-acetyltransferase GlmU [Tatlockia sp.]
MSLQIVILAAGQGKRMYSDTPKVLHKLAGKAMLEQVIETAQQLNPEAIHVIYGHGGERIKAALPDLPLNWIEQKEQLGTGHALMQALAHLQQASKVLVLSADVPLIQANTLQTLIDISNRDKAALTLLLATLDNPTGLGRIIRNENGKICAIIEEKDATAEQKQIKEIYSGICCVSVSNLASWLPRISNSNAQGEYYLTEIISKAAEEQLEIASMQASDFIEIQGVNNRLQLQQLERIWQKRNAEKIMLSGVTIADANRIDIRGEFTCDQDVFIDINAIFIGRVSLGKGTRIGPNCLLTNVTIGENCEIFANSVLEDCVIANHCQIGPFARLRPGTKLAAQCKIGNFVETKNACFDEGSKASHLSYLGDVTLGKQVNIGAGTITCNYDGANKHQTIIEDGVFIGSDTQLVAPVTIGANATIGAGSTIRKNVTAGELTLSENKQKTVFGWKRPVKKEEGLE